MARLTSVRDRKTGVVTPIHASELLTRLQIPSTTFDGWIAAARKLRNELMAVRTELNRHIDVLEEALDVFDPFPSPIPEPITPKRKSKPRKKVRT
jgi:hypothetical protein